MGIKGNVHMSCQSLDQNLHLIKVIFSNTSRWHFPIQKLRACRCEIKVYVQCLDIQLELCTLLEKQPLT